MNTHVNHLLRNLDPGRMQVTVATPAGPGMPGSSRPEVVTKWLTLPAEYTRSPVGFVGAVRGLRRVLSRASFDLCHAHGLGAALLCCVAGGGRGTAPPVAVTAHNVFGGNRRLLRYLARGRDVHVCAVSEAVRRSLEGVGSAVRVIPNGWPAPSERQSRLPGPCRLLYVGRLVPDKGIDLLLSALADIVPVPWRLQVAGEGPMEAEVRRIVRRRHLEDRVTLEGWIEDVCPLYRGADLLTVPSRTEGAGLVISEAMSCGLPVLASAVGGIPEMVRHGETGWLVPPGDLGALSAALIALAGDGRLREGMGDRARAEAALRPRWSDIARRVEAMYAEIAPGSG
ncbi:MAG: glycosyltransferase family 4 protein [Bacillota bacterium]